ncbi:MAG: hypothetical protein K2Y18_06910 [Alphaproteobacteria bacterium]|jgi:hypothetical protein|nr:hypothetical protein [Alphaproteobacteria bacterium]
MNIKLLSLAFITSITFENSAFSIDINNLNGTPPPEQSAATTRSNAGRNPRPIKNMAVAAPSVSFYETASSPSSDAMDAFTNSSASSSARGNTRRTTTAFSGLRRGNHTLSPVKIDPNFEIGTFSKMQGSMYVRDVFDAFVPPRYFYYGDVKTNRYRSYLADDGEVYTIQDVVGDGHCGDYTLSIDRRDLVAKTKEKLEEKDISVMSYAESLKIFNQPDLIEDLKENWLDANVLEKDLHAENGNIGCNIHLAAYIYRLNIEIYVPDKNSHVFDEASQENTIDRIKIMLKATYNPGAPVIRLIHRGEHRGNHFRYLYNKDNLQPGEELKIRKLEYALRQKIAGVSYEDTHREICSSQQKINSEKANSENLDSSVKGSNFQLMDQDDFTIDLIERAIEQGCDYENLKDMGFNDDHIKAAKARKQPF